MKNLNNYESVLISLFSGTNAIEMVCSHSPLLVFLKSFNLIRLWFSSLDDSKNQKSL